MSTGQDDFRFKTKNQNEECLFKNEDEMYQTDHKILQLENIIAKLETELENAKRWKEEGKTGPYTSVILKEQNFSFITRWYQMAQPTIPITIVKIKFLVTTKPVDFIENIIKRFSVFVDEKKEEKEDKIQAWKNVGDTNFYKSLDHLAYIFKKAQPQPLKNIFEELKAIARKPIH